MKTSLYFPILIILLLATLGWLCLEGVSVIFGNQITCPPGKVLLGEYTQSCIRVPVEAEKEVRDHYQTADIYSKFAPHRETFATIVFERPMGTEEAFNLVASLGLKCDLVYFFDYSTRLYSSMSTDEECVYIRSIVPKSQNPDADIRPPVILSITVKGPPKVLIEFWSEHSEQVRIIGFSIFSDAYPIVRAGPKIEE